MKRLFLVTLLLMACSSAYADCWLDGKRYPTGTEIDGFVCQEDGTWE